MFWFCQKNVNITAGGFIWQQHNHFLLLSRLLTAKVICVLFNKVNISVYSIYVHHDSDRNTLLFSYVTYTKGTILFKTSSSF